MSRQKPDHGYFDDFKKVGVYRPPCMTIKELSIETGVAYSTWRHRMKKNPIDPQFNRYGHTYYPVSELRKWADQFK